jgi:hypothetical protein
VRFDFDGTPRQQHFVFSAGTDLTRLHVEQVFVEVTYKEPSEQAQFQVLTITPEQPMAEWSLQTRAPSNAIAEYRVFVLVSGSVEPLRSDYSPVNNGPFNFSVPRHDTSIGEKINALVLWSLLSVLFA